MANHLAGLGTALAEAKPVDDVVEPAFEQRHERVARVAFSRYGLLKVASELPLEHAVIVLHLLLFAQVLTVVGKLDAALLVHAWRMLATLDRALGRIAARSFEEELQAIAATKATNWTGISCHVRVRGSGFRAAKHKQGPNSSGYTRRFLRGRQPLCGSGVMSSMDLTFRPAASSDVIALSRPLPGPLTLTSSSLTPNFLALSAACWAAIWPAKGVLLRLPLKPLVPALAQHSVSPFVSVIVTVVLLNVAWMYAMPTETLRRAFFLAFTFPMD